MNVCQNIISPDQSGFLESRYMKDSIRRVNNIIDFCKQTDIPTLSLFIDAEKAFDLVGWSFMFSVLKRIGIGPRFLQWVKLLYVDQVAEILYDGCKSNRINIRRGL